MVAMTHAHVHTQAPENPGQLHPGIPSLGFAPLSRKYWGGGGGLQIMQLSKHPSGEGNG